MKNILRSVASLLIVCTALAVFTACNDDENGGPSGSLTAETASLRFTGGSYSKVLAVEAEHVSSYAAEVLYEGSETGWVTPEVQQGGVKLTVRPNTTSTARSATLVLSAAGVPDVSVAITQKAAVQSDLIGKWQPAKNEAGMGDFFLNIEWTDPANLPEIPLWENDDKVSVAAIPELVKMLLPAMYSGGLAYFDFQNGGLFGVGYHAMPGLGEFDEALSVFPNESSLAVLPIDALTYFTQDGKLYMAVDKSFLGQVGRNLGVDLCQIIDGAIQLHPDLGIYSDDEVYALPFKYTLTGNDLTIHVDKEMMLPYMSLLSAVSELLLPEVLHIPLGEGAELGICVRPMLTGLLRALAENTTSIELGIGLTRQIE